MTLQIHNHYVSRLTKVINLQQKQEDELFITKGSPFIAGITLLDGTLTELPFNNLQEAKTYLNTLKKVTHE